MKDGAHVLDYRDDRSEHQPSAADENVFVNVDIELATAHLHGILDALM